MYSSHEEFWETSRRDLSQEFKLVWIRGTSRRDQSWSLWLDFEAKMASSHDGTCPRDLLQGLVVCTDLKTLENKIISIFYLLPSATVVGIINPPREHSMPYPLKKVARLHAFTLILTCIWRQDSTGFPSAESWLVNWNFRRASSVQGRYHSEEVQNLWDQQQDQIFTVLRRRHS